jgi:pimeloyl-ACP methyl ester carboxylesterase
MPSPPSHIILPDGRRLSFAEFGDRQGKAVFYFHGFPGSRLEAKLADETARDTHVRFIGIDRPGYGFSSFKAARTVVDWADDISRLADALGIERFSVLGVSGGGPYAAACAFKIPQRLDAAGIICGMGPVDRAGLMQSMPWMYRQGLRLADRFPAIATVIFAFSAFFFRYSPGLMLTILAGRVAEPDKMALKNNRLVQVLNASFREAFRSSLRWPAIDAVLYSRPWGFRLQDIHTRIHLWHGEMDRIVPPEIARYTARALPDCRATFYENEGHFSIILNRIEEIWKIFCI